MRILKMGVYGRRSLKISTLSWVIEYRPQYDNQELYCNLCHKVVCLHKSSSIPAFLNAKLTLKHVLFCRRMAKNQRKTSGFWLKFVPDRKTALRLILHNAATSKWRPLQSSININPQSSAHSRTNRSRHCRAAQFFRS